jgi:hypothetical protein
LVACIGFSATNSRESRQGRKAAAAAVMSGAGVPADAGHLLHWKNRLNDFSETGLRLRRQKARLLPAARRQTVRGDFSDTGFVTYA